MEDAASGLTYVLDENWIGVPALLRACRAVAADRIATLEELGIPPGTVDPILLRSMGGISQPVLLTRDGAMLGPLVQRGAWREARVTLFLFGKRWGQLPLGEMVRRLMFLWPSIVDQALASAPGAAWRVKPTIPAVPGDSFRLVTGQHADG